MLVWAAALLQNIQCNKCFPISAFKRYVSLSIRSVVTGRKEDLACISRDSLYRITDHQWRPVWASPRGHDPNARARIKGGPRGSNGRAGGRGRGRARKLHSQHSEGNFLASLSTSHSFRDGGQGHMEVGCMRERKGRACGPTPNTPKRALRLRKSPFATNTYSSHYCVNEAPKKPVPRQTDRETEGLI